MIIIPSTVEVHTGDVVVLASRERVEVRDRLSLGSEPAEVIVYVSVRDGLVGPGEHRDTAEAVEVLTSAPGSIAYVGCKPFRLGP